MDWCSGYLEGVDLQGEVSTARGIVQRFAGLSVGVICGSYRRIWTVLRCVDRMASVNWYRRRLLVGIPRLALQSQLLSDEVESFMHSSFLH